MRSHCNTVPEVNWELRENGRDLSVSLSVILLQILNQTLANSHIQFFLRRSRRRRARLRFLQVLEAVYLHFRVQRNDFGLEVRVYFTGGGGDSHILAIQVCAAGKGMVFKPFSLV